MADVPRSISLSTNVGRSKHIYDGVFSAPTATKRHASTFSIHIDDYRDIFSSSDASLGSSIPIFDLPPVDGRDIADRGRSSGIDYAGVFGGVGILPAEMPFRESKKKAKADSHSSRSSMPTKIAASKGQELFGNSGKIQALKSPTKTKTIVPEGQEFYSSSSTRDNPTPSQVSEGTRKEGTLVSKGQEFSSGSKDNDNSVSIQAPQTPTRTRMTDSKSQESCGSSKDNGMSSNVSTDQQSDGIKQLDIPLQKMNQTVKDAAAVGATQIAHLHAVPENIGMSSNVPTDQQSDAIKQLNFPLQKMNQTVKDAAVGVTQIAHLHPVPGNIGMSSNVPTDQQSEAIKQLNPLQKINQTVKDAAAGVTQIAHLHAIPGNIGSAEEVNPAGKTSLEKANHMSMDDTDVGINVGEGERQGKQIRSISDLGKEKKYKDHDAHRAFGITKSNTFSATQSVSPVSNSPQLFGSSDYFRRSSSQRSKSSTESQHNDVAAGSTSPLLELDMNSTAAASAAAVDRAIEEAEAKIRRAKEFLKGHDYDGSTKLSFKRSLKVKAASNTYRSEVEEEKLLKQKGHFDATVRSENVSSNDLNFTTSERQLPDEVGMLDEKLHGVSAQEDTAIKHASLDPLMEMEGSPEVVTLTEKSYKDDGAGEWEAAKQISQLISGVKNRFVSFISKQVDSEKTAVQDIPSGSEFLEQLFEGSSCHVEDADVHMKRENDQDDRYAEQQYEGSTFQVQDTVENDDEMNVDPSSGVEEIVHVSNICMNISKPEEHITVALEVLTGQQCNLSELELDSEVVDSVDMAQETAYQSEVHVLEKEAICKDDIETQKDLQDQELVGKGVDVSFDCEDESRRQEEVCSLRETEMPKDSEKKLENSQKVQKTCTDKFQETAQTAELFIGVSERMDDTIEHDKQNLEDCTDELQETVHTAEFLTKSIADVSKVTEGTFLDDEKKLDDGQVVEENCSDKEDNETVEDAKGKSAIEVTEATDDEKKLEDGVHVAELFMQEEDNETVEDAKGKTTVDVNEVTDDEKKLEDAQLVEETCMDKLQGVQVAELSKWEDNEKTGTCELDEKKLEEDQIAEETCIDKLEGGDNEKIGTNEHDENQFEDDQIAEETFTDKLQGGCYEHDEKKLEDAQLVEETCTDKLQGGAQVAELFTWEDNEKIDTSELDKKKLEGDQIAEETCTDKLQGGVQIAELFTCENNEKMDDQIAEETCIDKLQGRVQVAESIDSSEHDEKKLEDDQIAEETFTDELEGGVHVVELFTREDNQTIDTSEHDKKDLEDAEIVEETFTDKLQGGVEASEFELFTREHMDAVSKITPSVTGVAEDSSDHPGKELEDVQIVEETFPAVDLLMREDSEISEYQDAEMESALGDTEVAEETFDHDTFLVLNSRSSQYSPYLGSLNQGEERIEDPTISPSAPKMDIEQPVVCTIDEGVCLHDESSQYAQHARSYSGGEERMEELAYITHDLKMNAENASDFNKNVEEPIACHVEREMNVVREDICEQDVDAISKHDDYFPVMNLTCEQEQSSEMTNIESKIEGNIHQPSSVSTIHELIKEEMYEQTLAHEDECSPPADEKLDHEDECPLSTDASRNEVHSSVIGDSEGYKHEGDEHSQDIKFSCEDEKMAASVASISSETELRNEQPRSVQTVTELIREGGCECDVDFEQEYTCEEVFPVEINSETQGDEVEVKTDMGEVDIMHDVEPSYKRKQWSDDRVQGDAFQQSGIVLGDLDQENMQGSVDDGVETKVDDERVKESENGKSAEDVCHITKAYHRRRRWFEDREQEVLSTPIVSDVVQESESVNEVKNSTDAEAGRRRRRWFERREKLEPVQKPSILEDIGATPNPEEHTAKHVETGETSMESIKKSNHRDEVKREKEKKRERKAVQRAIREARERAFVDARERAAIAAQEKKEKASSEPKSGSDNKAAMDAKLREERAAVERATSEARERAMQKAIFEKSASMSKETVFKNQAPSSSSNPGYFSGTFAAAKSSGVVSESPRRRRAISERHKRTMERAAKALEEKNMRDFLAQKEQDERIRLADSLDVDVRRWLTGKDGNLRAMLSTLQYILGPDSGWQPIPLTDLLTSTAVRKAYKRAALCVHPDKLQQRGATIQQKYICEKVFDLLKDAWQKFNPDDW